MLKRSIAWGDPLHYSQRLLIEVWHDSKLDARCLDRQGEFMGEVDFMLELPPKESVIQKRMHCKLTANYEKARRKVRGSITFEYTWHPKEITSADTLLAGRLLINV